MEQIEETPGRPSGSRIQKAYYKISRLLKKDYAYTPMTDTTNTTNQSAPRLTFKHYATFSILCLMFLSLLVAYLNRHTQTIIVEATPEQKMILDRQNLLLNVTREYVFRSPIFCKKPENFEYLDGYMSPCWNEVDGTMCLPKFYLLGFPNCGTEYLWQLMTRHPTVANVAKPEDRNQYWNDPTTVKFQEYVSRVGTKTNFMIDPTMHVGDHSPTYAHQSVRPPPKNPWRFSSETLRILRRGDVRIPHLITQYTPNVKFIVLIRNPIERLYSQYCELYRTQVTKLNQKPMNLNFHHDLLRSISVFHECLRRKKSSHLCAHDRGVAHFATQTSIYLHVGLYADHLEDVFDLLSREQFKIIHFNDLKNNQTEVVQRTFQFLGLDLPPGIAGNNNNVTMFEDEVCETPMLSQTWALLEKFYWHHNVRLAELLGDKRYLFDR